MSKKTLYYHLGAEKCASSLIEQAFLGFEPFIAWLAQQGITTLAHHHPLLRRAAIRHGWQWDESVFGPIRNQCFKPYLVSGEQTLFASEEALLGLVHDAGKENECESRCDFLHRLTDGFEVRPIILFRRQDGFIESLYNQRVKRGETRPFETFFESLPLENYEWDRVADVFTASFGADKVTVLPYERTVYTTHDQPADNIVDLVVKALGLTTNIALPNMPVYNPSLPPHLIPAQLRINAEFGEIDGARIANILVGTVSKQPGESHGLFTDEQRAALVDRYRESNERLFADHLPGYDPAAYFTP